MKKALLFAIFALSINAFAQNKRPSSNSLENIRGRMEDGGWITSKINSENNLGKAFKHKTLKQNSLIQIFDSIYIWRWDTLSNGWEIDKRFVNMVYDANNNLTSEMVQSWNDSAWVIFFQNIFTYDTSHNQTSCLAQGWNGSGWVNASQWFYTYDANNNRITYLYQYWLNSAWVTSSQHIYTYDVNNNQTSDLMQHWNGSAWENRYQFIYTYDANSNLTSNLMQGWNSSSWINSHQYLYTYNVNHEITTYLSQIWIGSAWVNDTQGTSFTYDASHNLRSYFLQSWNGSAWVNSFKYNANYDANNNLTNNLMQSWNVNAWVNFYQNIYIYDANNFIRSYSYKDWNSAGSMVTSGDSTYNHFHTVAGINDLIAQEGNITIYPNPSSGKFTITSNIIISAVEIYNLLGERIYSNLKFNKQTSNEIDLLDHCNGIYVIKIYSGTKTYNRKIVVQ